MQEISMRIRLDASLAEQDAAKLKKRIEQKLGDKGSFSKEEVENVRKITEEFGKLSKELEKIVKSLGSTGYGLRNHMPHIGTSGLGDGLLGRGAQLLQNFLTPIFGHGITRGLMSVLSSGTGGWLLAGLAAYKLGELANKGANQIKDEEALLANQMTRMGYGSNSQKIRYDMQATGIPYNMTVPEMAQITEEYISRAGINKWRNNVTDILYTAKGLGVDPTYLAQVFGMQGKMGAYPLREFAELLVGAIQKTGMQGREQEFIDAINNLTQSAYQHQLSISAQERNDLFGILTYFGMTNPALKGEKGAQLAGGLQGMLQSGSSNPEVMAIMGYGSKYTGTKGYWELRKQLAQGLTTENLKNLLQGLNQWQADPYLKRIWLDEQLKQFGVDNPEMVEFLMRPDVQQAILSGTITQAQLDALAKGKAILSKNVRDRMQSAPEIHKKGEIAKQQIGKALGEPVEKGMQWWDDFLSNFPKDYGLGYGWLFGLPDNKTNKLFGKNVAPQAATKAVKKDITLDKESHVLDKKEKVLDKEMKLLSAVSTENTPTNNFVAKKDPNEDNLMMLLKSTTTLMSGITRLGAGAGAFFGGDSSGGYAFLSAGGSSGVNNFEFMGLRNGFNMTPAQVNAWINKFAPPGSLMRGQGAAFVEAARRTGLDVRYLVAHAALETAWGTSRIARDKYNFYGISAFDSNPYGSASRFSSPAEGIIGGAQWILQNYTLRGQDTLFEMRHNHGKHEYSTDPQWDENIAKIMATAPRATLNINVSGSIQGLTPANNAAVTTALVNKINAAPDLSMIFRQGVKGVTV